MKSIKFISAFIAAVFITLIFLNKSEYVAALDSENISISDMTIDKKNVSFKDCINISMKVSSYSSIKSIKICYENKNPTQTQYIEMDYNSKGDFYKGKLYIPESMYKGNWNIDWLKVTFTTSNKTKTLYSHSYDFTPLSFDLLAEDFNNNDIIDTDDLAIIASKYNLTSSSPNWDSRFDFNTDNICDIYDIVHVSSLIN